MPNFVIRQTSLNIGIILDLESEDFIQQFHRTELVDNCDVQGRHLKGSNKANSSNRSSHVGQSSIDQLHNICKNFTEPAWLRKSQNEKEKSIINNRYPNNHYEALFESII